MRLLLIFSVKEEIRILRNFENILKENNITAKIVDVQDINNKERSFTLLGDSTNLRKMVSVLNKMNFNCDNDFVGIPVSDNIGQIYICDYKNPGYLAVPAKEDTEDISNSLEKAIIRAKAAQIEQILSA